MKSQHLLIVGLVALGVAAVYDLFLSAKVRSLFARG